MLAPVVLLSSPVADLDASFVASKSDVYLVRHKGRTVYEKYGEGWSATTRRPLASGSKSYWGTLAVLLERKGKLKLTDKVSAYLPAWRAKGWKDKTVNDLLRLSTGLPGQWGMTNPEARLTLPAAPTPAFSYGPASFDTFGRYLEARFQTSAADLLDEHVLKPLKIDVRWSPRNGVQRYAGSGRTSPLDWATFGEFVMRDRDLTRRLRTPSPLNPSYGLTWWLPEKSTAADPATRREIQPMVGRVPSDMIIAAGLGKQRLYVIPSAQLVAVRMAPLQGAREFDDVAFLSSALALTKK